MINLIQKKIDDNKEKIQMISESTTVDSIDKELLIKQLTKRNEILIRSNNGEPLPSEEPLVVVKLTLIQRIRKFFGLKNKRT